jgi:hypothetical protein
MCDPSTKIPSLSHCIGIIMRPVVKTCIDYKPGQQNPNTYINPHLARKKLKMAMIRAILVKAGCSTPIMEKEDVMDILRDNDMHPQYVPFPTFVV